MSPHRRFALPGLALIFAFASFAGAAPLANPDLYSASEDTALSITVPGVLDPQKFYRVRVVGDWR